MAIAGPDAPSVSTGSTHEGALIACTLPLTPVFKADGLFAATAHPGPLLSVLMHRYYKIRDLDPLTELAVDGFEVVASRYRRHTAPSP